MKMGTRSLQFVACGAILLLGFSCGLAFGTEMGESNCDGQYCNPNVSGCTRLAQSVEGSCCKGNSGGYHCSTCIRDKFYCPASGETILGPAYECTPTSTPCQ